ncbi:hypothetical protein HN51_038475 [Arachis hypogaea]|uniref:J domain-containing protein n=1 Tax=Arachis hypogaea TaxID=3818 RepID=A0A444ZRY4_ARAHY|nr:chaperone protein dnaJ 20, chloroplastic [Arachis hypogaea]QHO04204.1 Chaperone protein dnaJ 20 [Arachis hypogaea]RYR16918.1 hypothetical protein Ahy_B03g061760 [Arachis hypogaea]
MRFYPGLTITPTDHRFCVPTATNPVSLRPIIGPIKSPNRVTFSFKKPRATLNGATATEDKPVTAVAELSFYELLGISESGSLMEIKQAYKQLARKYHPDVSPPGRLEEYTKRFIRVQEAYETLSDPTRRAMYDNDMARGVHFAFNARRSYHHRDQVVEHKSEWKSRWQSQLSELKRRSKSKSKDEGKNMSWAARMRQQRNESSDES